jgi:electron transfer flavoprotein alpha subunit
MAVLLLAEVTDGELALDATAKAVTAAGKLGDVTVLCAGGSAAAAGEAAAKIAGVSKVLVAEDSSLGHRMAESTAALIVSLAGEYSHIVAPATTDAKKRHAACRRALGRHGTFRRIRCRRCGHV